MYVTRKHTDMHARMHAHTHACMRACQRAFNLCLCAILYRKCLFHFSDNQSANRYGHIYYTIYPMCLCDYNIVATIQHVLALPKTMLLIAIIEESKQNVTAKLIDYYNSTYLTDCSHSFVL